MVAPAGAAMTAMAKQVDRIPTTDLRTLKLPSSTFPITRTVMGSPCFQGASATPAGCLAVRAARAVVVRVGTVVGRARRRARRRAEARPAAEAGGARLLLLGAGGRR